MTEIRRKNNPLQTMKPMASSNIDSSFNPKISLQREEDGGEAGGDAGGNTLSVEQLSADSYNAALNKERRQPSRQGKFGLCPFSEDPNNLLGKKNSRSCGFGGSPKIHPLLAHSQQFSGDDPTISANPIYDDSDKARERFLEKRLENQLRLQKNLGLGASKSITLAR